VAGDFRILNLPEARFECTFGRGCDGVCCREGRPPVYPEERELIAANLTSLLPDLRSEARALVEREGFVSKRRKEGHPMLRVVRGWCVFFHQGCVLHRHGEREGDPFKYKPAACALFPITRDPSDGAWYVRQKGYRKEAWDLPCLEPGELAPPASASLQAEIALAERFTRQGSAALIAPPTASDP